VRSLGFRYPDLGTMHAALAASRECEFLIPGDEGVSDGEWVLAIFEVSGGRATAAAAKASSSPIGIVMRFEPRDWRRLREFALPSTAPTADPASTIDDEEMEEAPPTTRPSVVVPMQQALQGSSPSILLVDDDPETTEMVTVLLEAVGLSVEAVPSAELALDTLRRREFGLVVLDWSLPGMTGLELCERLRHDPRWAVLPILFLTGNSSHQDMMQAFAAGADDFVTKPFRASELGARIFALLRRARLAAVVP